MAESSELHGLREGVRRVLDALPELLRLEDSDALICVPLPWSMPSVPVEVLRTHVLVPRALAAPPPAPAGPPLLAGGSSGSLGLKALLGAAASAAVSAAQAAAGSSPSSLLHPAAPASPSTPASTSTPTPTSLKSSSAVARSHPSKRGSDGDMQALMRSRFHSLADPSKLFEIRAGRLVPVRPRIATRGAVIFALRMVYCSSRHSIYAALLHQPIDGFSEMLEAAGSLGPPRLGAAAATAQIPPASAPAAPAPPAALPVPLLPSSLVAPPSALLLSMEAAAYDDDDPYVAGALSEVGLAHDAAGNVRRVLDHFVSRFGSEYDRMFGALDQQSAEVSINWARGRMRKLVTRLLVDARPAPHVQISRDQLSSYCESYVVRRLRDRLMYAVSLRARHEESELEARLYRFSRAPLEVWGASSEMWPSMERGASVLRALPHCFTPLGKLRVLRRALAVAVGSSSLLGSDDLLPILISMVVRGAQNIGFVSQMAFCTAFYLSDDIVFSELGFLLTSYQAAYHFLLHEDADAAAAASAFALAAVAPPSSPMRLSSTATFVHTSSVVPAVLASSLPTASSLDVDIASAQTRADVFQGEADAYDSPAPSPAVAVHATLDLGAPGGGGLLKYSPSLEMLRRHSASVVRAAPEDVNRAQLWGSLCGELFLTPVTLLLPSVRAVACGERHALILTTAGAVYSFGSGGEGALGHDDSLDIIVPTAVAGLSGRRVVAVAAGGRHSLAVDDGGALLSWGWGEFGQLGVGNRVNGYVPSEVLLPFSDHVVEVAAGGCHSLCLTAAGAVYSWGRASEGRLGVPGLEDDLLDPSAVSFADAEPVVSVRCGWAHSVALTAGGVVYGFGRNGEGQLGSDGPEFFETPRVVGVPSRAPIAAVFAGFHNTACLSTSGELYVLGLGESGQLGPLIQRYTKATRMVPPFEGDPIAGIAFAISHSVVLTRGGRSFCVGGDNRNGQLADFLPLAREDDSDDTPATPARTEYYDCAVPGRVDCVATAFWFSIAAYAAEDLNGVFNARR